MSNAPQPNSPTPVPVPANPSPWIVQASGADPVPVGSYLAVFRSADDFSNPEKGVLDKWKWTWEIQKGAHAGKTPTALTDKRLTVGTHAGRLIGGMAGRPLQPGEDVESLVKSFIGKMYLVSVQPGPKGGG